MLPFLFKAIFIYFIISFIRSLWRGYKMVEAVKKGSFQKHQDRFENEPRRSTDGRPDKDNRPEDVIEAEFRVLDKDQ